MLGDARAAIDDAIRCWPKHANTAKHNVQYRMANDSHYWNIDALRPMFVRLGIFQRIIRNTVCVDCRRLSIELLNQPD